MDTRALGSDSSGASPCNDWIASWMPRAPAICFSGAPTRITSVEGPPSGSFNRTNTKVRRSISSSDTINVLTIRGGSPPVQRAGSAVILTRSFRQRRSCATSSIADWTGAATSHRRRAGHGLLRWPLEKFRYEKLGRDVERIPLKNAADDDDRVRPHDVDDRVAPELGEVVRADHGVVMAAPDFVDSRFELDHMVQLRSGADDPFHVANDTTERESSLRVAARQLLEHLQHSILVEATVPKIGFDVRPQLELSARLCGGRVDPCGCQALQMVTALIRIDDVNRLVATLKPLLDERKQHAILLVLAVEECADMACFAKLRAGKGNGRRVPLH